MVELRKLARHRGGADLEIVTVDKTNTVGIDPGAGGIRPDANDGSDDVILGDTVNKTVKVIYEWPGSYSYVSYQVITRRIRSIYSNDSKSEWLYSATSNGVDLETIGGVSLKTIGGVNLVTIEAN